MTIQEEIQELRALRGKIITAMNSAAETVEIENYNFNDSNGGQSVKRRSPKELMAWLEEIDKKITLLERKLRGGGLRTFGTNRYA